MVFRADFENSMFYAGNQAYTAELSSIGGPYLYYRNAKLYFDNDWTLSVAWGGGTYSSNYDNVIVHAGNDTFIEEPTTVEVAIFSVDAGTWLNPDTLTERLPVGETDVIGYVNVLRFWVLHQTVMQLPSVGDVPVMHHPVPTEMHEATAFDYQEEDLPD